MHPLAHPPTHPSSVYCGNAVMVEVVIVEPGQIKPAHAIKTPTNLPQNKCLDYNHPGYDHLYAIYRQDNSFDTFRANAGKDR